MKKIEIKSINKKLVCFSAILTLVLGGTLTATQIARADPHGMYYTAVGQQQLFFNVLAALDQADYVETSKSREDRRTDRESISANPPFTRELQSGARFTEETRLLDDHTETLPSYPYTKTKAGEPSLTNRQITLDGTDLYTDQLVRDLGAESARRNAASELLVALCASGFGVKNCDYDLDNRTITEEHQIRTLKENTTITNPLSWEQLPIWNGGWAALNSGNTVPNIINPHPEKINPLAGPPPPTGSVAPVPLLTDEEYRAGKNLSPDIFGNAPFAYSAEIDYWRQFITAKNTTSTSTSAGDDYNGHVKLFDDMYKTVVKEYLPAAPVKYPYQEYIFANGADELPVLVGVSDDPSVCGGPGFCLNLSAPSWSIAHTPGITLAEYIIQANEMVLTGTDRMYNIADEAAARIASQQEVIEDEGLLADTFLSPERATNLFPSATPGMPVYPLSNYGELTSRVNMPVAVREASIYGMPNILGMLATSQQASSLEGLDIPGAAQLVRRPAANPTATPVPTVTPIAQLLNDSGQVAGTLDLLFDSTRFYDRPKQETSPSANIISPILEYGARHALKMLTAGTWRGAGGNGWTSD
jgi:hypothetical protein